MSRLGKVVSIGLVIVLWTFVIAMWLGWNPGLGLLPLSVCGCSGLACVLVVSASMRSSQISQAEEKLQ